MRDATPGFRETEPDQAHQHGAEQICEDRGRAQHRRGYSWQPKNAGADDAVDGGGAKTADADHALEMRRGRALASQTARSRLRKFFNGGQAPGRATKLRTAAASSSNVSKAMSSFIVPNSRWVGC